LSRHERIPNACPQRQLSGLPARLFAYVLDEPAALLGKGRDLHQRLAERPSCDDGRALGAGARVVGEDGACHEVWGDDADEEAGG
jgi:hypothetical protein